MRTSETSDGKPLPEEILLRPIGTVESKARTTKEVPVAGGASVIRIRPAYLPALHRIGEHSHLWVLCWFHQADRDALQRRPGRFDPSSPPFGVFALRSPCRPNPIALSLVKLERREENLLYVTGLDAIDGTPVLDVKPYFESDIIFSPRTPYIHAANPEIRYGVFRKQALAHHGEACVGLELGIRMALLADENLGQIQAPGLCLEVSGDPCLADVLQGLTRARLANPPRFRYREGPQTAVLFTKEDRRLRITLRHPVTVEDAQSLPDTELFEIEHA